jgi:uncharacterized protein (TIGR02996 family)
MSMTPAAYFLEDIVAHPEDDAVRLIFADWLEEHDDPRGELIHVQIELTRLSPHDERRRGLRRRERDLLAQYGDRWRDELPAFASVEWGEFERGFVTSIRVRDLRLFLHEYRAVYEAAPIQEASFRFLPGMRLLQDSIIFAPLRVLDLSDCRLQDSDAVYLFQSPHLANLRALQLRNNNPGYRGVGALAHCPYLARLESLGLANNAIGDHGAFELAASTHLGNLTALDLAENPIFDAGALALATSATLTRLDDLYLSPALLASDTLRVLQARFGERYRPRQDRVEER